MVLFYMVKLIFRVDIVNNYSWAARTCRGRNFPNGYRLAENNRVAIHVKLRRWAGPSPRGELPWPGKVRVGAQGPYSMGLLSQKGRRSEIALVLFCANMGDLSEPRIWQDRDGRLGMAMNERRQSDDLHLKAVREIILIIAGFAVI
jgi:hypothetical protein